MKIFIETERLLLREIIPADREGMFELDADPAVHRFLGNKPVQNIEQAEETINFIRNQYITNGIGRWAVIEKETNNFLGWSGLKLITEPTNNQVDFYEIGYRLIKRYWGKGFATESARAVVDYGFEQLNLAEIYAMADSGNAASVNILKKSGLSYLGKFDFKGEEHDWLKITKNDWISKKEMHL